MRSVDPAEGIVFVGNKDIELDTLDKVSFITFDPHNLAHAVLLNEAPEYDENADPVARKYPDPISWR